MRIKIHSYITIISAVLMATTAHTQVFFGAGNSEGITVTSSSNANGTQAESTVDGQGLDADLMESSRFISQATFGLRMDEIEYTPIKYGTGSQDRQSFMRDLLRNRHGRAGGRGS